MTTATAPATAADIDEYMTVAEVAKALRVSKMTIYTEIHSGALFATVVGRRSLRIPTWSYAAYVSTGAAPSMEPS